MSQKARKSINRAMRLRGRVFFTLNPLHDSHNDSQYVKSSRYRRDMQKASVK